MINQNWARWIMASASVYFKAATDTIPLPFMVEGINERTEEELHSDHAELRINGPHIIELSKDFYQLHVDFNILLTDKMKETNENAYDLQTWCGVFQSAMDGPVTVYKYGIEVGDDSSFVGCLTPRHGKYDSNKVLHFGQIHKVDRIRQSVVDGKFHMDLKSS